MLSKMEIETETNESFKKEKKRKKSLTPKSSKKQKLSKQTDEESPKKSPKQLKKSEKELSEAEKVKQQLLRELEEDLRLEELKIKKPQYDPNVELEKIDEPEPEPESEIDEPEQDPESETLDEEAPEPKTLVEETPESESLDEEEPGPETLDEPEQDPESVDEEEPEPEILEKPEKKFDPKKFRQLILNKQTCYGVLKDFIELCGKDSPAQDYALEYLEAGGNTSEILHIIDLGDVKTASFVLPIIEVLTIVLIKIISAHQQKQLHAEETCREFLNKHHSVVKSMLSLNSSTKQRKSALKMLSAMVALSPSTAKEVLTHASFDSTILEILYQPSNLTDGTSVRTHFIHFLISFLVDGHPGVISAFLEKRNLLTSIFPGLIYDSEEIVTLVLSTIQSKILEDKSITKTCKMNLFNTRVIHSLVNLYNWKGPNAWNPKKRKEIKTSQIISDKLLEVVQKFLLCLCASKHGIIFFDPTLGLSTKKYNPLLLTVLAGLSKPWLNKYKQDLVIKVCVACPDVVKSVLHNIEGFLEPRSSDNWLQVINFVQQLILSLNPKAIEQFLTPLQPKQFAQVVQNLCVPHNVLVKLTNGMEQKELQIRHECVNLLNVMLSSAQNYLQFNPTTIVKNSLSGYLSRCLPPGSVLLKDWYKTIQASEFDTEIDETKLNDYLTKLLDVLYQYNKFCPDLVENITKGINVKQFLKNIDSLSEKHPESYDLHIKAINLLISCDITIFAPSKEFFSYALPLLIKFYYETNGQPQLVIEKMLLDLWKLSGIFDCCVGEIQIWLYSILDQPEYNPNLAKFLTEVLVQTHNQFLKYSNQMNNLKEQFTESTSYRVIIENLSSNTKNTLKLNTQCKHRVLSPFILGFLDLLSSETETNDEIISYINVSLMNLLHYQTNPPIFINIVLQYSVLSPNLHKYFTNWKLGKKIANKKDLSPENTVYYKLIHFLSKEELSELSELTEYCTKVQKYFTKTIMTNLIMFYYTQKSVTNTLTPEFQSKCYQLLLYVVTNSEGKHLTYCLESILDHPLLIDVFSPTLIKNELSTDFIISLIKELQKLQIDLDNYLKAYQAKVVEEVYNLLHGYNKYEICFKIDQLMDTIKLFGLSYENCSQLLNILSKIPIANFKSDENKKLFLLKLESFIFGHESNYANFQPFPNEILKQVNNQMIEFNTTEELNPVNLEELELNLSAYIGQFPHANINFNSQFFESIITKKTVTKSGVRLATILLQNNPKYVEVFMKHLDKIYDKRELVFSLINSIRDVNLTILDKVYKEYEQILLKYLNKPQKAANYLVENYQVVIKLIVGQLKLDNCKDFCGKTHKFDSTEIHHFEALTTIFNKTIIGESSEELKQKYLTNYLTTSMNLLINLLKRPTKTEDDWAKVEKIAKQFCTYIIKTRNVYKLKLKETKLYSGAVFQSFAKLCLKFGLQGLQEKPILVTALKHLCSLASDSGEITDLGVLFEMAISHSESLNILLSDDDKKAPLLSLLLTVCKRCKSVMAKSHIPIWLSAYEATLTETDQYLLQLLSMYESANIGFHEFRPYLWGKAAVAHYSVRSSIETTLWRQPKPKEVLDLFNENRIVHTVRHFPWTRRLHDTGVFSDSDIEVYDPAFYLPLLSHLLAPESTIRWYQCTQRGIISLPIIALTSENEAIRAAACNVLARFHGHLEAATYAKQRFLWLHLIEAVCRGTSILPSLRPCTIVAVFLARCSIIFTRPDHPLYSSLGNYISAKECPNFNVVPELLTMLHSTDINHSEHRNFILEVIRDGLCTDEDLKVLYKSVAFKLIMDLYNSILIDTEGRQIILEILAAAVTLQNGARTLVSSYNIISWLHAVLQKFNQNSTDLLSAFIKIINNLIISFEDELFKHLQFNILLLLVSVIDKFKTSRLDKMPLVKYIQVLYKVYEKKPNVLTKTQLLDLLKMSSQLKCTICNYYLDFGAEFVETPTLLADDADSVGCYYLKLLTLKWIHVNKS